MLCTATSLMEKPAAQVSDLSGKGLWVLFVTLGLHSCPKADRLYSERYINITCSITETGAA